MVPQFSTFQLDASWFRICSLWLAYSINEDFCAHCWSPVLSKWQVCTMFWPWCATTPLCNHGKPPTTVLFETLFCVLHAHTYALLLTYVQVCRNDICIQKLLIFFGCICLIWCLLEMTEGHSCSMPQDMLCWWSIAQAPFVFPWLASFQ